MPWMTLPMRVLRPSYWSVRIVDVLLPLTGFQFIREAVNLNLPRSNRNEATSNIDPILEIVYMYYEPTFICNTLFLRFISLRDKLVNGNLFLPSFLPYPHSNVVLNQPILQRLVCKYICIEIFMIIRLLQTSQKFLECKWELVLLYNSDITFFFLRVLQFRE